MYIGVYVGSRSGSGGSGAAAFRYVQASPMLMPGDDELLHGAGSPPCEELQAPLSQSDKILCLERENQLRASKCDSCSVRSHRGSQYESVHGSRQYVWRGKACKTRVLVQKHILITTLTVQTDD